LADAETIFTLVDLMRELGLTPQHVKVKVSHRQTVRTILLMLGVPDDRIIDAFNLLDRRDKMETDQYNAKWLELGLDEHKIERFDQMCRRPYPVGDVAHLERSIGGESIADLQALDHELTRFGIADWCEYDLGIVRGLAYYTGTVYEAHEISGAERAIAGGGRYDKLIELMGGPAMPAVGFGMGDVVLSLVLADKGLLPDNISPPVDAFVFPADDDARDNVCRIVTDLRTAGLHTRMTYKTTTNVGKLLKEAAQHAARYAVIVETPTTSAGNIAVKNLTNGNQSEIPLADLVDHLRH
ncbi:MAG: ATP phosphoribosyltransferase regulatory subunit, partial [Desulfobacterales bacterium]|nr:ATP phosphoribosyltransferase regulatory subunit [Desulfobacterales bacterium]